MANKNELLNSDLYKPNSKKSKEEPKEERREVSKVISGSVRSKERSVVNKAARAMFTDDVKSIKDYILMDVLIPTIKDAISQIIKNGSDMLIFGDVRPGSNQRTGGYKYHGISTLNSAPKRQASNRRVTRDFREEIFETRADAEEVLSQMNELIEHYGNASVSDFYSAIGETPKYTDRKWGWTSLEGVGVRMAYGGFIIEMPRAEELEL